MAEAKKLEFTQREAEIMAASFQALKSPPEYDYVKLASLLNMTNHNSAANAIRSVRKKIDTYGSPDGVPPTTKAAPKRGKAGKAGKSDDANVNEENTDPKASTKKKTATRKKADVANCDSGTGINDDIAATPEDSSATSTSPKRKNGSQQDNSPKKRIRETKIKSEKTVKEEEELSEDEHITPTNGTMQENGAGDMEKSSCDAHREDLESQNDDDDHANVVKQEATDNDLE